MHEIFDVSEKVQEAINRKNAIVALESRKREKCTKSFKPQYKFINI